MSDKWYYSFDGEHYDSYGYDSEEEATKEAYKENKTEDYGHETFWVGKSSEVATPNIDVTCLLETLAEDALGDNHSDYAMYYLDDVRKEHEEELGEQLNDAWYKWVEKHGYKPNWFVVHSEDVREIRLEVKEAE